MEFSLGSNSINTSSETLIELVKKQDFSGIENQFDDGSKFEAAIKNQGTTINEAVSDIRKTVEESKKDSTAAYIAKQEAKVFAKGGTIEGYYITGAAVQSGNTLAINLTSKDGRSIKAQLEYGKDGSKIITLSDKKTNTTTEVIYDNTGHKLQETISSLGGTVTTTYNTVNGQDIPVFIADVRNGNGFGCNYTYFNSKGQTTRTIRTGSGIGVIITDYEYNQSGKLIATKSVQHANTPKGGTSVTTTVYETNSKGEQAEKVLHTLNSDGSTKVLYKDIETGKDLKTEETDKDGVVTTVTDHTKNPPKTKTLYNANLDSQEGVISISRAKSGALSCVDCTQEAFDNFVPPEKSAPNSSFIVIANSNHGKKKSFSYDADGNLIKNLSQPAPKEKPFDATGVLKYDINKDGKIDVNDVVMPDYDINGDGRIDIIDATEAQKIAQKIQKYAAEVKGYEEIGKNAEYDINGDGKVDVLDATQALRAADAIQRYLVKGSVRSDKQFPSLSNAEIAQKLQDGLNNSGIKLTKDEAIKLFDINGDGKLDIADVNQLKQMAKKANDFARGLATPTAEDLKKYDIDGNGKITTYEYGLLNSKAVFAEKYLSDRNTSVSMQFMAELYDTDGDNKITQTDVNYYKSSASNLKATGVLKYDTDKNGTINVNDVKMPDYDINGDGTLDITDATEAQRIAQKIQKYAAEVKGYEEIGKNAEYDINGDGRVDVLDATQAQRVADAIQRYLVGMGQSNNEGIKPTGILKYDTNKDGTINVNDVKMPDYDINGDGTLDITDATEAQRIAQKIQKYAAEVKGYEEIGKNAEYDINGDGRVDVLDATQAQRVADAIQRYLVGMGQSNNEGIKASGILKYDTDKNGTINVNDVKYDVKNLSMKNFDLNGDKSISEDDAKKLDDVALKIQKYAAKVKGYEEIGKNAEYDINGDGRVDVLDATQAQRAAKAIRDYAAETTPVNTKYFDATGILKYDTDKNGTINVNDVKYDVKNLSMANFDINGDKSISEDDAKKLDDVALKIQKYAAEVKGYEEIGKNAEYDINGDGRVDVLDATQAQRAAQAIRDYIEDTKQDCPEDEHLDDDREGAQFNDFDENLNEIRDLD